MTTATNSTRLAQPVPVTETLAASAVAVDQDASDAEATLYTAHYRPLVGLAMLLVDDIETAEEVVQDSFAAMHAHWRRLHNSDKALWYLRQCGINRPRSLLRHRRVVDRKVPPPSPDMPSAEQGAITLLERDAVVAALQRLPVRQREALVLRYYVDLSEAEIASAMGISRGAVKSHSSRAMSALRGLLVAWDMSQHPECGGSGQASTPAREQSDPGRCGISQPRPHRSSAGVVAVHRQARAKTGISGRGWK
jgi:RNA polymerase sigma-70 factor (sigma-E family)